MDNLGFQRNHPKKRIGTAALLFNNKTEILLVKTSYRDHWGYPGGVVDANESPREALTREIREEINLDISDFDFVCVTYYHDSQENIECIQFKFTAKPLTQIQIAAIRLNTTELEDYKFVSELEAKVLLAPNSYDILQKCIRAIQECKPIYLE